MKKETFNDFKEAICDIEFKIDLKTKEGIALSAQYYDNFQSYLLKIQELKCEMSRILNKQDYLHEIMSYRELIHRIENSKKYMQANHLDKDDYKALLFYYPEIIKKCHYDLFMNENDYTKLFGKAQYAFLENDIRTLRECYIQSLLLKDYSYSLQERMVLARKFKKLILNKTQKLEIVDFRFPFTEKECFENERLYQNKIQEFQKIIASLESQYQHYLEDYKNSIN